MELKGTRASVSTCRYSPWNIPHANSHGPASLTYNWRVREAVCWEMPILEMLHWRNSPLNWEVESASP